MRLHSLVLPLKTLSINPDADKADGKKSEARPQAPRSSVRHRDLNKVRFNDKTAEVAKGYVQNLKNGYQNVHNVLVVTDYLENGGFRSTESLKKSPDSPD